MQQDQSPKENLALLRQLAESGRDAPLMAGPYLVAGGGWFAVSSLFQWQWLRELLDVSATQATRAWLIAAIGFAVHLAILIRRDRHKTENSNNRAINAAWTAAGVSILAFFIGVSVLAYQKDDFFLMNLISLQVLSVYGIAWGVATVLTKQPWMKAIAVAAFISIPLLSVSIGTGHEGVVYATTLLLTAVIPGIKLTQLAKQAPI